MNKQSGRRLQTVAVKLNMNKQSGRRLQTVAVKA